MLLFITITTEHTRRQQAKNKRGLSGLVSSTVCCVERDGNRLCSRIWHLGKNFLFGIIKKKIRKSERPTQKKNGEGLC